VPRIIAEFDDLVRWLEEHPLKLVALDGYHGAGKSTLALDLSRHLNISVIHVDDYIEPNTGTFIDAVDLQKIELSIEKYPVLLDGVCILKLLELMGRKADAIIYVRSLKPKSGPTAIEDPLAAEVTRYHREYNPEIMADIIYDRTLAREPRPMDTVRASIDIAYINARTRITITLAVGGMLTLIVGLILLLYGITGQDRSLIKFPGIEISAGGLGGVIMATSAVWAFFAYKAAPSYAHSSQVAEKYNVEAQLLERTQIETSTQTTVNPNTHIGGRSNTNELR
jgi:hypothetical protein